MLKLPCPSCGGEVEFRSRFSIFAVCSYCQSSLVRHDTNLEDLGKVAELQPDMSPWQIGASGKYRGNFFYVAGRVIVGWRAGSWNEWYLTFDNGDSGWLAEAQGMYAINFPYKKEIPEIDQLAKKAIGHKLMLGSNKNTFTLLDRKRMKCIGSEGELPFTGIEGRESLVLDFGNSAGGFLSIEMNEKDGNSVYLGEYLELKKLSPTGLKLFEGWVN